jgi:PDZ domain
VSKKRTNSIRSPKSSIIAVLKCILGDDALRGLTKVGLIVAGVVAGYGSALFIQSIDKPTIPLSGDVAGVRAPVMESSGIARENDELQAQIATLKGELAAERLKGAIAAPPAVASIPRSPEEFQERVANATKKVNALVLQEENDRLLAAGFSMSQIQRFRERSAELVEERRKAETERRMRGLPAVTDIDYLNSNGDLDLRNEIGVDAYEKYRVATGRLISVPVSSVQPGSIAESVGLKPGDKIISYNNQRVYDIGQVTKISDKEFKAGTLLTLEVQRNGVLVPFTVPAGNLGIAAASVVPGFSAERTWNKVKSHIMPRSSGTPN